MSEIFNVFFIFSSSYQQDSLLDEDRGGGNGYSKQFSGFQSGTGSAAGGYNSQDFQGFQDTSQ